MSRAARSQGRIPNSARRRGGRPGRLTVTGWSRPVCARCIVAIDGGWSSGFHGCGPTAHPKRERSPVVDEPGRARRLVDGVADRQRVGPLEASRDDHAVADGGSPHLVAGAIEFVDDAGQPVGADDTNRGVEVAADASAGPSDAVGERQLRCGHVAQPGQLAIRQHVAHAAPVERNGVADRQREIAGHLDRSALRRGPADRRATRAVCARPSSAARRTSTRPFPSSRGTRRRSRAARRRRRRASARPTGTRRARGRRDCRSHRERRVRGATSPAPLRIRKRSETDRPKLTGRHSGGDRIADPVRLDRGVGERVVEPGRTGQEFEVRVRPEELACAASQLLVLVRRHRRGRRARTRTGRSSRAGSAERRTGRTGRHRPDRSRRRPDRAPTDTGRPIAGQRARRRRRPSASSRRSGSGPRSHRRRAG